jgi:hypothetical protein
MKLRHLSCLLLAATALTMPGLAEARADKAESASARAAELESRLNKLEAEMTELRGDLGAARAAEAQSDAAAQAANASAAQAAATAQTVAQAAATRVATLEKQPQPEGMRSGNTTLKIGGYLKLEAADSHFANGAVTSNTLGRDFYLPQTIPTQSATGKPSTSADFTAKQTRLWLNLDTQVSGHTVKGYLETDFQTTASASANVTAGGSQRTTNGYTLALRRAYLQVDHFTFGQDWTTFQYVAALPESTDYVGATEGTVFVRQPLIRYSQPLGKGMTLHLGVENPESAVAAAQSNATTVSAVTENGNDHLPDFTARMVYANKAGELSLAGLFRQVRVESTGSALTNNGAGLTATGVGGSVAGKLFLNEKKTADLRFMATYGQNIGRYVGLNFAPDAIYVAGTNTLSNVKVFAGFAALRVPLSPQIRANVIGSYQHVDYGDLTLAQDALFSKQAWSLTANLFYSPVKPVDLGIEYRHGERELVNGAKGTLDRIELAAKYNF